MKCEECKYRKFHPKGDAISVIEFGDDPYEYFYCDKGNWCGSHTEPTSQHQYEQQRLSPEIDLWKDCKEFAQKQVQNAL